MRIRLATLCLVASALITAPTLSFAQQTKPKDKSALDDPYADTDVDDDPYKDPDADAPFKEGLARMAEHDYEEACPAIAQSYHLDPRPGTLFTLADCEAQRGRLATAVTRFKEFVTLVTSLPQARQFKYQSRKDKAEKRRAALEPSVPQLTLTLTPEAPWTTVVKLDGAAIELGTLATPRPMDPGPHVIVVQVPGTSAAELRVSLDKGEKKSVSLPLDLPARPCSPAPTVPRVPPCVNGRCDIAVGGGIPARPGVLIALGALVLLRRRRRSRSGPPS